MSDYSNLQSVGDLMAWKMFISPAKRRFTEQLIILHESLMNMLKSRGPKRDPCGALESTAKGDEGISETRT
jgi:hypothetical protein